MKDELINTTRAWDKENIWVSDKNRTHGTTHGGRSIHWATRTHGEQCHLKCHWDRIVNIHFFTFSCTITHVFKTFISENLRPPLIFLVPALVEKWSKWHHTLKNTTRVEIIIKINKENCTNIRAKFFVFPYENCSTNCYCSGRAVEDPTNDDVVTSKRSPQ